MSAELIHSAHPRELYITTQRHTRPLSHLKSQLLQYLDETFRDAISLDGFIVEDFYRSVLISLDRVDASFEFAHRGARWIAVRELHDDTVLILRANAFPLDDVRLLRLRHLDDYHL